MIAKTNAERQREHRARLVAEAQQQRAAGLVRVCVWAHPEDATAIRAAAAKAAKQRAKLKDKP